MKPYGERHYGGAFDIDPEEYWTRDDLNELQAAIEEKTGLEIKEIYVRKDESLDIVFDDGNENELSLKAHIVLDPDKAGTCEEMVRKYAPIVSKAMQEELQEWLDQLEME